MFRTGLFSNGFSTMAMIVAAGITAVVIGLVVWRLVKWLSDEEFGAATVAREGKFKAALSALQTEAAAATASAATPNVVARKMLEAHTAPAVWAGTAPAKIEEAVKSFLGEAEKAAISCSARLAAEPTAKA